MQEILIQSLGWEDPLKKEMASHTSILTWGNHGERSLLGYSPWGGKESDMTEQLTLLVSHHTSDNSDSKFSSVQSLSHVRLCVTLWTLACWARLSVGFSRQEYWRGLPYPSSGDLPNPGTEPASLASPILAGRVLYH